jgi:hypothetical protein
VIVAVFEVQNTTYAIMANQLKILFNSFGLLDKVIVYVKNKWSNLNTLTNVLKSIVFCSYHQLLALFVQDHVLVMQC